MAGSSEKQVLDYKAPKTSDKMITVPVFGMPCTMLESTLRDICALMRPITTHDKATER